MDKIRLDPKLNLPIAVGTTIFITDYIFGWLSFILGPFPMLFVLSIIIGILTRKIDDAIVVTVISFVIGIGVCALVTPFILGVVLNSPEDILSLLFITGVYATRGPLLFTTGLSVLNEGFLLYFLVAPLQYFLAPGFCAFGVVIGERLRKESVENDEESLIPMSTEQEKMLHGTDSTN